MRELRSPPPSARSRRCCCRQHRQDADAGRARLAGDGIEAVAAQAQGYRVNWDAVGRLDDTSLVNGIAKIAPSTSPPTRRC
ncbi:hypothetical protein AB5I41_22280 [Sphingomonas sp. MMS24-JH45]